MIRFTLFVFVIGITSCASWHWSNYYLYTNVNPSKFYLDLPDNFEECLNQFDTILSYEVIKYFKSVDSTIAAIHISQEIGGLFINFWNLRRYTNNYDGSGFVSAEGRTTYNKRYQYKPGVIDSFVYMGVTDSEAMMRVLFSCYHKRLNSKQYDWVTEISKVNSYWIPAKYGEGKLSPEMKKREHKVLVDYHFKHLSLKDTVNILHNRAPRLISKIPDWHYLTGIIEFKIPESKSINLMLIDIKSEFGDNYMLIENDTISIVDTLTSYSDGWLKRGTYYFNYHRNTEYRTGME